MTRRGLLRLTALALGLSLFGPSPARAHHSFAGTYSNDIVTVEGTVTEFLYRNPHSAVRVETVDAKLGKVVWTAEWAIAGQLSRAGIEKDSIKPGDRVILTGNPSRNTADHRMLMATISRPADGWKWPAN